MALPYSVQVEVEAGGPFRDPFSIELRAGVTQFVWENGEGKTWLMRLLAAFAKRRLSVGDLVVNNEISDELTGATATARFGSVIMTARQGKVPKMSGEVEYPIEGLPDPIASLTHADHMKGDAAAFKARLRALLKWIGIEGDEKAIRILLGEDPAIIALWGKKVSASPDLCEMAGKIRDEIHALRREVESTLVTKQRILDGLMGRKAELLGPLAERDVAAVVPDVDGARKDADQARDWLGEIRTRRETMMAGEERRLEALRQLGPRPTTTLSLVDAYANLTRVENERLRLETAIMALGIAGAQDAITACWHQLKVCVQQYEGDSTAAALLIHAAAHRLAAAHQHLDEVMVAGEQLGQQVAANEMLVKAAKYDCQEVDRVFDDGRRWDATVEQLKPQPIPTEAEVQSAAELFAEHQRILALHETAARYQELGKRIVDARTEVVGLETRIETFREEAEAVWARLANVVNERLNSDNIRVYGEKIEVDIGGVWRDIADDKWVSEGIRHSICYDLLLKHRSGPRVILIEGATTVGAERMNELGRQARAKDIVLTTETPVGAIRGERRVVYYPESWP